MLSAKDWALMKAWHEEGIPLPIVLEAIESCFVKASEGRRNRVVSSLAYCRHAVKEIWSDRRDMYVGGSESVPESDVSSGLQRIAVELRELASSAESRLAGALERAADAIEAMGNVSTPSAEERLTAIEESMFEEIRSGLDDSERAEIDAELDRRLTGSREISPDVAERTREANLRGILRSRYRLPRLSLFA